MDRYFCRKTGSMRSKLSHKIGTQWALKMSKNGVHQHQSSLPCPSITSLPPRSERPLVLSIHIFCLCMPFPINTALPIKYRQWPHQLLGEIVHAFMFEEINVKYLSFTISLPSYICLHPNSICSS